MTDGWKIELALKRKQILAEKGKERQKLSMGRGAIGEKKGLSFSDRPLIGEEHLSFIDKTSDKAEMEQFEAEPHNARAVSVLSFIDKTDDSRVLTNLSKPQAAFNRAG